MKTAEARFFSKALEDQATGCWEWTGALTHDGYGRFFLRNERRSNKRISVLCLSHRWSYEFFVGPIPDGLQLDHLCRNRRCVNPQHLEPVTGAENARRGSQPQRTHCIHNHEFTPENTRLRNGGRVCRACCRRRHRAHLGDPA